MFADLSIADFSNEIRDQTVKDLSLRYAAKPDPPLLVGIGSHQEHEKNIQPHTWSWTRFLQDQ